LHFNAQIDNAARWRRLRGDWLRATVELSTQQQTHEQSETDMETETCETATDVPPLHTFMHDARMLAHDDGEGRPLRYLSLYGGMVTRFL
jgi:hypothetical protein